MLFRAADIECKNVLILEEFRIFLNKLNLNLSPSQISKLK